MFFEVLQARIDHLLDPEQVGMEKVALLVKTVTYLIKATVRIVEALVHRALKISEATVIDEDADKNGERWPGGRDERSYRSWINWHRSFRLSRLNAGNAGLP
ncbi:MAG: hypothetical protein JWN34_2516 [Bryobacterales bacterium]|nr:hypothetical protein [Bryobacterales bacterium]